MTGCGEKAPEKTTFVHIWRLAWPQMLMMITHFFIGFVDVLVAGKIDKSVQASLGYITQSLMFFLILAIAVSGGSVAAIGQSLGACKFKRADRYAGLSLYMALFFGGLIFVLGNLLREPFIDLLHIPDAIRPTTSYFLSVYLLVVPAYYLLQITNAMFRARKIVLVPFFSMLAITIVNTVADFGLGLGLWGLPNLGYKGLAWATFFSVLTGAAINLAIMRRMGLLNLKTFPPMRWVRKAWPYLFKVAWPAGAMQVFWQTAYLLLFTIVGTLPLGAVDAVAGMTAGLRIEAALFLPAFAFNATASILVGHNLGEGRPGEAKRVGYVIMGIGCSLMTLMGLVVWYFVPEIVAFVAPDPGVQAQAGDYLFYNIMAIPFIAATMILGGSFIGAGATIYNLLIFGSIAWGVRIPLAWLLGHVIMKSSTGIWISMFVTMVLQAAVMLYIYQFKNWQRFAMRRTRNNNKENS